MPADVSTSTSGRGQGVVISNKHKIDNVVSLCISLCQNAFSCCRTRHRAEGVCIDTERSNLAISKHYSHIVNLITMCDKFEEVFRNLRPG